MSGDNPYLLSTLKTHKQYNGIIKFKDASIYKPEHVYLHELCPLSFLDFTGLNNKDGPGPAWEFWQASIDIYWSHMCFHALQMKTFGFAWCIVYYYNLMYTLADKSLQ